MILAYGALSFELPVSIVSRSEAFRYEDVHRCVVREKQPRNLPFDQCERASVVVCGIAIDRVDMHGGIRLPGLRLPGT
jgi:hypothetical protein